MTSEQKVRLKRLIEKHVEAQKKLFWEEDQGCDDVTLHRIEKLANLRQRRLYTYLENLS